MRRQQPADEPPKSDPNLYGAGCDFSLVLSDEEQKHFLELAVSANNIQSVDDYRGWIVKQIRPLFPHEMMISGYGSIVGNKITTECLIGVGYWQQFIDQIPLDVDLLDRPLIARWYRSRKPQLVDEFSEEYRSLSEMERSEIESFGLRNIAAHGLIDLDGRKGSYFSFSRVPEKLTKRHGHLLELLVPHLHQALLRATGIPIKSAAKNPQNLQLLSRREQDVLGWIIAGKKNREIAKLLCRSEMTIRNQVHSSLAKLGVPNRTQAVSKAIVLGFQSNELIEGSNLRKK